MQILRFSLAIVCVGLATAAPAQRNPRSNVEARGTVRPAPDNDPGYRRSRDIAFRAWKGDQANRLTSHSYRGVLRFAECVARFDRAAAPRAMRSAVTSAQSGSDLVRMSAINRGCAVEYAMVHPLLLRAALAETRLKLAGDGPDAWLASQNPVGVPAVVDGYRLRQITDCQVRQAPQLVRSLLATQPGERAERQAAEALFAGTVPCGPPVLGRLTPTAARLAIVEAEYTRRFVAGRASR